MSRTSLGQRNDMAKREDVPSMRMVGSAVRLSQDKYQQQATLNFQEEVDSFLFMRDKCTPTLM